MALRDHVEGREAVGVATLSVLMWVGICFVFGLPTLMMWIVGVLLFLGGVLKSGSSTPDGDVPDDGTSTQRRKKSRKGLDESIYGPPD